MIQSAVTVRYIDDQKPLPGTSLQFPIDHIGQVLVRLSWNVSGGNGFALATATSIHVCKDDIGIPANNSHPWVCEYFNKSADITTGSQPKTVNVPTSDITLSKLACQADRILLTHRYLSMFAKGIMHMSIAISRKCSLT